MEGPPDENSKSAHFESQSSLPAKYEKLRFSLPHIRQQNPDLIVDEDIEAFVKRTGLQRRVPVRNASTNTEHGVGLVLKNLLEGRKDAKQTSEQRLSANSFSNFSITPITARHLKPSAKGVRPEKLSGPNSRTPNLNPLLRRFSSLLPSPEPVPKQDDPPLFAGSAANMNALNNLIDRIGNKFQALQTDNLPKSQVIKPPEHTINTRAGCGTIYLQCLDRSTNTYGTAFLVHRSVLWVNSTSVFKQPYRQRLYDIPVEEDSLATFVNWLYHQSDIKLDNLATDRLCKVMAIAIPLGVDRLYNLLVQVILKRYTRLHGKRFAPSKDALKVVYEASEARHPVRRLFGFLLARNDAANYSAEERWKVDVGRDVEVTNEMVRKGGWEAIDLNRFFL